MYSFEFKGKQHNIADEDFPCKGTFGQPENIRSKTDRNVGKIITFVMICPDDSVFPGQVYEGTHYISNGKTWFVCACTSKRKACFYCDAVMKEICKKSPKDDYTTNELTIEELTTRLFGDRRFLRKTS